MKHLNVLTNKHSPAVAVAVIQHLVVARTQTVVVHPMVVVVVVQPRAVVVQARVQTRVVPTRVVVVVVVVPTRVVVVVPTRVVVVVVVVQARVVVVVVTVQAPVVVVVVVVQPRVVARWVKLVCLTKMRSQYRAAMNQCSSRQSSTDTPKSCTTTLAKTSRHTSTAEVCLAASHSAS